MKISPSQLSHMVFQRSIREDYGQISLDGNSLNFLVEVDGQKTVAEIMSRIGIGLPELRDVLNKLLERKLIETARKEVPSLDADFMGVLKRHLSLAVGPIAEVLIEDATADLGCEPNRVPVESAAELVELLSREIQREAERMTFQETMVQLLKTKGYSV